MENFGFDQDLYFRQLSTYGPEMMKRLIGLKVYIQGLRGIGIETAKNLILAGPRKVVIQDENFVEMRDLGSNFYCREENVGADKRAKACLEQLRELNPYVDVSLHEGEINEEFMKEFDVIVFTEEYRKDFLIKWNNWARSQETPKGFVWAGLLGLYGFTFVDFGKEFEVIDKNGEDPKRGVITDISNEEKAKILTHTLHNLMDGDHIMIKEVEGMPELNQKVYKVKTIGGLSLEIEADTSKMGNYIRNGIFEEVIVPTKVNFKSLQESLSNPNDKELPPLENPDLVKFGRPEQLHVALNALLNYVAATGSLPTFNDKEEAIRLTEESQKYNDAASNNNDWLKVEEVDENVSKNIARFAKAQTSAHASFWGGVVAQEILKYTKKYMPLRQWLHFDQFELLPSEEENLKRELKGTRYDDQIAIFGNEFQESLSKKKIFLIGAGALGCEFLKQFALSGVASANDGSAVCTDDDVIETSNLNRQFLFRRQDIQLSKSQCACKAAKKMNPKFNVQDLQERVTPENIKRFDDEFWEGLDFVVNAVDNVKARLYIDNRCVFYNKPLFESGTLGTKCNSQSIIPGQTQSYGDSQDPQETSIPMCTLRNFPYQIEHCIEWARDYFEGEFSGGSREYAKFSKNPQGYLNDLKKELQTQRAMLRQKLEVIHTIAENHKKATHQTCIKLAREKFQDLFFNDISTLIFNLPKDARNKDGSQFWGGLKRFPTPIKFDPNDEQHQLFLEATAELYAFLYNLEPINNKSLILKDAQEVQLEPFKPKEQAVQTNENEQVPDDGNDEPIIEELLKELNGYVAPAKQVNEIIFEKDDDTNHHIDFISALSNLRARNYTIDEVPRFKVKTIAGKITPAIATSTAMIVGLVGMEIFKLIQNCKIDVYRNSFCNLALPLWVLSETLPPEKFVDKDMDPILMGPVKAVPNGFTKWDKIEIKGPKTLKQISEEVKEKYGVNLSLWGVDKIPLLGQNLMNPKMERMDMLPDKAYFEEMGKEYPQERKYMEISCYADDDEMNDCVVPLLRYQIK